MNCATCTWKAVPWPIRLVTEGRPSPAQTWTSTAFCVWRERLRHPLCSQGWKKQAKKLHQIEQQNEIMEIIISLWVRDSGKIKIHYHCENCFAPCLDRVRIRCVFKHWFFTKFLLPWTSMDWERTFGPLTKPSLLSKKLQGQLSQIFSVDFHCVMICLYIRILDYLLIRSFCFTCESKAVVKCGYTLFTGKLLWDKVYAKEDCYTRTEWNGPERDRMELFERCSTKYASN